MMFNKVIAYIRTSTNRQDLGLEFQLKAAEEYHPAKVYQEQISGRKEEGLRGKLIPLKIAKSAATIKLVAVFVFWLKTRIIGIFVLCLAKRDQNEHARKAWYIFGAVGELIDRNFKMVKVRDQNETTRLKCQ